MTDLIRSWILMFMLLNPFLIIIYLLDIVQNLDKKQFNAVLLRAGIIATIVFFLFAILGDVLFSDAMNLSFESFQIFGGIVFLLIGLQFVFRGPQTIEILQGKSKFVAGAIAMPILIGPGTISVSVVIGKRHEPLIACMIIFAAVAASIFVIQILKSVHDQVRTRNEPLIERYIEITGRLAAIYIGTVAIEMIMNGLKVWITKI
jgi:multiple antibiotic resistance protein